MASSITPAQTVGPFPHESWRWAFDATKATTPSGTTVTIHGTVYDGAGQPINDAVLEAWTPAEQAQPMRGFRRVATDEHGKYSFELVAPAADAGEPVFYLTLFARGLVRHQFTAVFLEDDAGLASSDILQQVPEARRATLLARKTGHAGYQWDIRMQSDRETVFFDYR